jgi:hypothetical protein
LPRVLDRAVRSFERSLARSHQRLRPVDGCLLLGRCVARFLRLKDRLAESGALTITVPLARDRDSHALRLPDLAYV